eukprot:1161510-Pelagomonas_calceolata.AAC.7
MCNHTGTCTLPCRTPAVHLHLQLSSSLSVHTGADERRPSSWEEADLHTEAGCRMPGQGHQASAGGQGQDSLRTPGSMRIKGLDHCCGSKPDGWIVEDGFKRSCR